MAYGGGTWRTQNKILPGSYINFASVARATLTISDRGVAAAPFLLSWGPMGEVRLIEQGEFLKNCFDLFGYSYSSPEMLCLREIFLHAIKVYTYRMPMANAAKAACIYATAKYEGVRGNDIRIVVDNDPDTPNEAPGYIVTTMVGSRTVEVQKVKKFSALVDNDWLTWTKSIHGMEPVEGSYSKTEDEELDTGKTYYTRSGEEGSYVYTEVDEPIFANIGDYFEQDMALVTRYYRFINETAEDGIAYVQATVAKETYTLTGGADGVIEEDAHEQFLSAIEPFAFNALCCPVYGEDTDSKAIIRQYASWTEQMRDEIGAKFQLIAHKPETADYEGVIGLWNDVTHSTIDVDKSALTYWLTGAEASCNINESLTNTKYDGELTIDVDTKQSVLEEHIERGHLVFHNSNGNIVILTDINSLVTLKENFGAIFQKNQTIRVCDQIAMDIARQFNLRYLGIVQNDATGRASLWNDIVYYLREMERLRAITEFEDEQVTCEIGNTKDSVLVTLNGINVVNAMEKLYMSVIIQ